MTRHSGLDIRDADLAEEIRHGLPGPLLAIGQFRVRMEVPPPSHDLRSELLREAFHLDRPFVAGVRFTCQAEQGKYD